MSIDTRLRTGLASATDSTPVQLRTDISLIKGRGDRLRRRDRIAGWTASIFALVVAIAALVTQMGVEDVYLADGEVLLATDPVVVQGEESPEPLFDTSGLGVEQSLQDLTSIERAVALAERTMSLWQDAEIIRIATIGTTVGGLDSIVLHAEATVLTQGPEPVSRRLQMRCIATSSGSSCGGNEVELGAGEPGGLLQPGPDESPSYTTGGEGDFTWEVPEGTSVVVLMVNGESIWQRPVGGVAVFDTTIIQGDLIRVVALDQKGVSLKTRQFIAPGT